MITFRKVVKRWGWTHGMQIIGFCHLWRSYGSPPMDGLRKDIKERMAELGVSKSAGYRYLADLKEWAGELHIEPVDVLAQQIAAIFDVEEENTVPQVGLSGIVDPA